MIALPLLALVFQNAKPTIQVDPLLIVQADEVWSVIGRRDNPVWPGWDAHKTPILIDFPGKQDLLINHPKPPEGFRRYEGPVRSKAGPIFVRDGATTFDLDGQNTSTLVNEVETLVVADTLSTRRQWVKGLAPSVVAEPARADEIVGASLVPNPYASMLIFAHEAFHVYQRARAPQKAPDEMALVGYPSLSVANNVGYALEADLLANALDAKDDATLRHEALRWLAVRLDRRKTLPLSAQAYEDATEFEEGLAKYVEYRTLQILERKRPAPEMWLVQGFHGYEGIATERARMVRQMRGFMNGTSVVNDDPYGASPVRFRLYYSGMAIGALLDRLGARWHDRVFQAGVSPGSLVADALRATPAELAQALAELHAGKPYAALVREKTKLAEDGDAHVVSVLHGFDAAPGELVIDYSDLKKPDPKFVYTSFGILRVDENRNVFRLIPIRGEVGGAAFREDAARPVLTDRQAKTIRFQLTAVPEGIKEGDIEGPLRLPGLALEKVRGSLTVESRRLVLKLSDRA